MFNSPSIASSPENKFGQGIESSMMANLSMFVSVYSATLKH